MGPIDFLRGQSLTVKDNGQNENYSRVFEVGNQNYLDLTIKIYELDKTGGTVAFNYKVFSSMDRVTWSAVTDFTGSTSSSGTVHKEGPIRGKFFKFGCSFDLNVGAPSDLAWITYDAFGNLTRSG